MVFKSFPHRLPSTPSFPTPNNDYLMQIWPPQLQRVYLCSLAIYPLLTLHSLICAYHYWTQYLQQWAFVSKFIFELNVRISKPIKIFTECGKLFLETWVGHSAVRIDSFLGISHLLGQFLLCARPIVHRCLNILRIEVFSPLQEIC